MLRLLGVCLDKEEREWGSQKRIKPPKVPWVEGEDTDAGVCLPTRVISTQIDTFLSSLAG